MEIMNNQAYHLLFYKPFQVLSQFSPEGDKKTLADFIMDIPKDVYPVGRLDYDSEGLLFLTNDKILNHKLLNPSFSHEREYWAQVEGIPTEADLQSLRDGVILQIKGKKFQTRAAKIERLPEIEVAERQPPIRFRKNIPTSWISLTLTEGKNRQVRRMTAAIGFPTLRLLRYRIGGIYLSGMKEGAFRKLSGQEVQKFFL